MPGSNTSSAISSEWELWEGLLNMGSASAVDTRELAIEQSIEAFVNGMAEDPAYQADAIIEGITTPIVASRRTTIECDVKAPPGTNLHIGDLVECLGEKWIVVELFADKVGIINAKMWVCNDILRFQNRKEAVRSEDSHQENQLNWRGDIRNTKLGQRQFNTPKKWNRMENVITRYCVIDDGSYSRTNTDPVAYVPVNTYKLYVSMDSDTIQMYIDKRLSFGRIYDQTGNKVLEVYKITGIDLKSKNFGEGSHLMVLTLQRDVYNEATDDFANMLCDYYVSQNDIPHPTRNGSCVIVGKDTIRIGTSKKYTASFVNENEEYVSGIAPVWTISVPDGVTQEVSADGVVTIGVPFMESLIGSEIIISVTDSDGIYGSFEKKVGVITVG